MDGSCSTPVMATMIEDVLAGATVIVNAVVDPLPLKVSLRNATLIGVLPMNAITVPLRVVACCPLQAKQGIFGNLCLLGQMVSMQKLLSTEPCLGILKVDTFIAPLMQSNDHAIRCQQSCQPN